MCRMLTSGFIEQPFNDSLFQVFVALDTASRIGRGIASFLRLNNGRGTMCLVAIWGRCIHRGTRTLDRFSCYKIKHDAAWIDAGRGLFLERDFFGGAGIHAAHGNNLCVLQRADTGERSNKDTRECDHDKITIVDHKMIGKRCVCYAIIIT